MRRPPAGSTRAFVMPEIKIPNNAPNCIARLAFLKHADGNGLRSEMTRAEFAHYLVGEGKGEHDDHAPPMFMMDADDRNVPKAFAEKWIRRDRSLDPNQPGSDGKNWPLYQAYCVHVLREPMYGEPRHYRLMVSPEEKYGVQTDMPEFTRALMTRINDDMKRELIWVASAHYNTPRPHVHIGVRGMDTRAEPVYFHKQYWQEGIRDRAREILWENFGSGKGVRRAG